MPVYGTATDLAKAQQLFPNLPAPPQRDLMSTPELARLAVYLNELDRALVDLYTALAHDLNHHVHLVDDVAFGAADTTKAITFDSALDAADYHIFLTPSWNAALWYSSLATTGFTINASAAPGGAGGTVFWSVVH